MRSPAGTHPIYWRSFPYSPPDDWELTTISDLCDRVKGKLATDLSEKRSGNSRRYLLTGQLNCVEEPCYTCQADIPDVKPTDTVMAVDGTVGAVFTGLSGALGSTMMRFRPRDLVDHEFIYYLLHSLEAYFSATAIVGAVPHLDKRLLSQLLLKTPGKAERKIIGGVLRAVDEMLSATNAELLAAQRLKTALMQQLFTKGIPGRHKTFKKSKWLNLPSSWNIKPLHELADVTAGFTMGRDLSRHKTVTVPYVTVINVQDGFFDLSNIGTVQIKESELQTGLLKPNDVLMTEGGDRDKLGRGAIWTGQIETEHSHKKRWENSLI